MGSLEEILAGYDGLQAGQEAFYKDLHQHPELSHQEHRTAERVAGKLQEYGCTVQTGIGGTGVVGVLANGAGPTVLLRAELDALPVKEDTGADYASTATAKDAQGHEVPVPHACGHDMHMSCLLGMVKLMSDHRDQWSGTLLPLFQPAEETGDGAQAMVDDGLFKRIPVPDVALTQHLLSGIAGTVLTRSGPFMATEDSINVTVYGKGGHGTIPQHTIDPVVLVAMAIVRLQTIVSREVAAFAAHFGDHAGEIDRQTVSEDFSNIPNAAGVPYTYWALGYTDEKTYRAAEALTTAALAWLARI